MAPGSYDGVEAEIRRDFGNEVVTSKHLPSGQLLFRIADVQTPRGCQPSRVQVLLVYDDPARPPEVLVSPFPTLSNGNPTPNPYPKLVDGETWYHYSVRWNWEPTEAIWENVRRKIMRFASTQ